MTNKEKFLAGHPFQIKPNGSLFRFLKVPEFLIDGQIIDQETLQSIGFCDNESTESFITFPLDEFSHFLNPKAHNFDNLIFQNHE